MRNFGPLVREFEIESLRAMSVSPDCRYNIQPYPIMPWQVIYLRYLLGLPVERRMRREHALHSKVSFASPPHLQTGVLVVPQLVHLCIIVKAYPLAIIYQSRVAASPVL